MPSQKKKTQKKGETYGNTLSWEIQHSSTLRSLFLWFSTGLDYEIHMCYIEVNVVLIVNESNPVSFPHGCRVGILYPPDTRETDPWLYMKFSEKTGNGIFYPNHRWPIAKASHQENISGPAIGSEQVNKSASGTEFQESENSH